MVLTRLDGVASFSLAFSLASPNVSKLQVGNLIENFLSRCGFEKKGQHLSRRSDELTASSLKIILDEVVGFTGIKNSDSENHEN